MIKKVHWKGFLFLLTLLSFQLSYGQKETTPPKISGNFQLDSTWRPMVYLSVIESFNQLNTMSKGMIIASSPIDSGGNFSFELNNLPSKDQLYRIHVAKKSTSAASLIIGGREENHFFLIVNAQSSIQLKNKVPGPIFGEITTTNSLPNAQLRQIDEIAKFTDSIDMQSNFQKSEFIQRGVEDKLRSIADTASHPLVSLYALYKSNFDPTSTLHQAFYTRYFSKWATEKSVYFTQMSAKFGPSKSIPWFGYVIGGLGLFGIGLYIGRRRSPKLITPKNTLAALTIQEHKILEGIQAGKSNKAISEENHIEMSTVKTHVRNIYSKLNISSRKEAFNLSKNKS